MELLEQHPIEYGWRVLTATSAPRLHAAQQDQLTFQCYGIATNGDRIEYRLRLTRNELRAMAKSLGNEVVS
jgi:hypothetical protein